MKWIFTIVEKINHKTYILTLGPKPRRILTQSTTPHPLGWEVENGGKTDREKKKGREVKKGAKYDLDVARSR